MMSSTGLLHRSAVPADSGWRRLVATALGAALLVAATVTGTTTLAPDAGALPTAPASTVDWGKLTPDAGYTRQGAAPVSRRLQVTLGFVRDQAGLEALAGEVSDPSSPRYRAYVGVVELSTRFGVDRAAWARIDADLRSRGLSFRLDASGAFAVGTVTVAQAQDLFGVTFSLWDPPPPSGGGPPQVLPALYPDATPVLPTSMLGAVDLVRGLSQWGQAPAPGAGVAARRGAAGPSYPFTPGGGGDPVRTGTPAGCQAALDYTFLGEPAAFTPNQLRTAYGVDRLHDAGFDGRGASAAIVLDQPMDEGDLRKAEACFGFGPVPFHQSNPAGLSSAGNDEGALDVQTLAAIAPGLDRLDFLVPDLQIDPGYDLTVFTWIFAGPLDTTRTGGRVPDMVSASTGPCEQVYQLPENRALVPLTEFVLAMSVAAGSTWFVATGDFGSSNCARVPFAPQPTAASAVYPSTSRWTTAVGGTNLALHPDNTIASSGAWNDVAMGALPAFASAGGGGTSALIGRPAWQAVPDVAPSGGRTVPDIAHFAATVPGYFTFVDGKPAAFPADGTSLSTPLTAGMAAVLAGALRAEGQAHPGQLAPLLYRLGSRGEGGFRDITIGTVDLFGVGCCSAGPGYDLATGWGSFDLSRLVGALRTPTARLSATPVSAPGASTTLVASVTAPAGTVLRYEWDVGGDGIVDRTTTTPSIDAVVGAEPTTVTVTAVTDLGRRASASAVLAASASAAPVTPAFTG